MNKKRGGFTWIEMLVLLVIIGVLAAILWPAFVRTNDRPHRNCVSKLMQLGMAFLQYSQEYDERFPPVKLSDVKPIGKIESSEYKPFGWADAANTFIRDTNVFHCPSEKETVVSTDPTQSGYTDYWCNSNLSNLELKRLISPTRTILSGDGNDGSENTDARYSLNDLPQEWRDTAYRPATRHNGAANYLFADGHVKSFKPQDITTLPTGQSSSTFSIR